MLGIFVLQLLYLLKYFPWKLFYKALRHPLKVKKGKEPNQTILFAEVKAIIRSSAANNHVREELLPKMLRSTVKM